MAAFLFKLEVCWRLLCSAGFVLVWSDEAGKIRVTLDGDNQIKRLDAKGSDGATFGCTEVRRLNDECS
jgi:hypothetical protein